jgi:2-oxoglutarate dehydrogenase E1 component
LPGSSPAHTFALQWIMSDLRDFYGPNAGYVLGLFERFQQDPGSVDEGWRAYFQEFGPPAEGAPAAGQTVEDRADIGAVLGAHELSIAIRARGHTAARLSPLGEAEAPDPALRPEAHGVTETKLEALPAGTVRGPATVGARNALEAIQKLRAVYSGTTGYEFEHIIDATEREWLREMVESGRFSAEPGAEEKRALLRRLSQVEGFEKYLHKAFFGQKRFSLEGTDLMVPMLDEMIEEAGIAGARDVVIGMAHRGRLNVLAHVLQKPYSLIVSGFAGASHPHPLTEDDLTGDVKYHMGWRDSREIGGQEVHVTLSPNPSHLEYVNPVVVGMTRAAQDETDRGGMPIVSHDRALAILIHGDAAFPGQGTVAETLNMSQLRGFSVGGTIHLIVNNQIGFTTLPESDRSTRYSSDLAKGYEIPVVHVNADDPGACLAAARLAWAYRERFKKDFVIDLVGYRRWGHNEGDEPAFTQPRMYDVVRSLPTARELWAEKLVEEEVVTRAEADEMLQSVIDELSRVQAEVQEDTSGGIPPIETVILPRRSMAVETAVPTERVLELNDAILARPEGFEGNPRLTKLLERRRDAMGAEGGIDWGHAETLAFASLLTEGTPIRLTGQDAERGTFSHRHLVLHDAENGSRYGVLDHLPGATASFEVHNSPLSELAVVGFEFGYSVFDPAVLVIWEAQFGDFVNGAQVMIDQFISSSYQKWGERSGLVLLLPHGYEGQGPEHSSARLERFLQIAAEGNLRVVNCTTAGQYFHLMRRQAALLQEDRRPLVVMSPKSLLRHPLATSNISELANGSFQPILVDPSAAGRETDITRLLLCSGKIFVDLLGSESRESARNVAMVRVEELYPLPNAELRDEFSRYPGLREIVWVQEEPKNMGAWHYIASRLRNLAPEGVEVSYVGRPDRASPAEGYASLHAAEQSRIVQAAWYAPQELRARLA